MKNIDLNEIFLKLKDKFQVSNSGWVKLNSKEKINLLEQLSNLINSWIPITNAFSIISYQTKDKKIKALVVDLLEKINKWIPLRESCANYSSVFSAFDIAIIEMWEVTWKLGDSIELIKEKEEKKCWIKKQNNMSFNISNGCYKFINSYDYHIYAFCNTKNTKNVCWC